MQRLIYTEADQRLHAYKSYGAQKILWNETTGYSAAKPSKDTKQVSLSKLYKSHTEAFNEYLKEAIGEDVSVLVIHKADTANTLVDKLSAKKRAKAPVADALRAEDRFWHVYPGTKHWVSDPVPTEWALLPTDYIPQAPDLPSAETSVRSAVPGATMGETYWEYVCVLIAIVKQEGYDAVAEKTGTEEDVGDLDTAVQALHKYYVSKGIQYDDSSTRRTVMNEWGYSLVLTGPVAWTELHKKLTLKQDETYIVDISDHTVKIRIRQDLPAATEDVASENLRNYYETFSEEDNYDDDEMTKPVLYVFKK